MFDLDEIEEEGEWSPNHQSLSKVSVNELAADARQLFFRLIGTKTESWLEMPVSVQHKWESVVEVCKERVAEAVEVSWSSLVSQCTQAFYETEKQNPRVVHLVWEAVIRHIVNVLVAENAEDSEQIRPEWYEDWLRKKLQGTKNG